MKAYKKCIVFLNMPRQMPFLIGKLSSFFKYIIYS